jgi:hypothetical protein
MRLHPSVLIDNEEYIIEIQNKNSQIKHVYRGKRKVNLADKISEEGIYDSLWFTNLEIIYINDNITLKVPRLKRSSHMCYTELEYTLFQQNGKKFNLCETEEDEEEEVIFYDCYYYENCILPKLVTTNMNNTTTNDEKLLSCV